MKVEEFIDELTSEIERDKKSFINNMNKFSMVNKTFVEWLEIFVAWMEWSSEEDYSHMYGWRSES